MLYARSESCAEMIAAVQAGICDSRCTEYNVRTLGA